MANRPIVAQPGSATVTSVRREPGLGSNVQRTKKEAAHRDSRRAVRDAPHRVFVGHTHDPRDAESVLKPEIAWCEQNCRGLWTILYGPFQADQGYTVRFGFTEARDADAFSRHRQQRREHGIAQFGWDNDR
jgi:hypothetical protein